MAFLDLAVQYPTAPMNTSFEDCQEVMGIPNAEPGPAKGAGHEELVSE